MKGCSTVPRFPELEPHHQIQFSAKLRTPKFWKVSYPSAGDTVSIFLASPTGQLNLKETKMELIKCNIICSYLSEDHFKAKNSFSFQCPGVGKIISTLII